LKKVKITWNFGLTRHGNTFSTAKPMTKGSADPFVEGKGAGFALACAPDRRSCPIKDLIGHHGGIVNMQSQINQKELLE